MKKAVIAKVCFIVGAVLLVYFAFKNVFDFAVYSNTLNSAPFYITVMVNAVCFVLPGLTAFAVGIILKKRSR